MYNKLLIDKGNQVIIQLTNTKKYKHYKMHILNRMGRLK